MRVAFEAFAWIAVLEMELGGKTHTLPFLFHSFNGVRLVGVGDAEARSKDLLK